MTTPTTGPRSPQGHSAMPEPSPSKPAKPSRPEPRSTALLSRAWPNLKPGHTEPGPRTSPGLARAAQASCISCGAQSSFQLSRELTA